MRHLLCYNLCLFEVRGDSTNVNNHCRWQCTYATQDSDHQVQESMLLIYDPKNKGKGKTANDYEQM